MKGLKRKTPCSLNYIEGVFKCSDSELQLKPTLTGGQCFRWKQVEDCGQQIYQGVFNHKVWMLTKKDDTLEYKVLVSLPQQSQADSVTGTNSSTSEGPKRNQVTVNYKNILSTYLRLDVNLVKLYNDWSERDPCFKESTNKFFGIRVLRQDPIENIFSFICSTNNNITRITSMVEKLCYLYGEKLAEINGIAVYDFPQISSLASKGVEEKLRKEGFGYRAKFIHQSAMQIMEKGGESWIKQLQRLSYPEAKQQLVTLPGIGAKVADCICLMSLNHLEAIPVDTHVFQISQRYLPHLRSCKTVTDKVYNEIACYFQNMYGEYAGWAHSVLFCADLRQFQTVSKEEQPNKKLKKKK